MNKERIHKAIRKVYRFLPVQLLFLHWRKYQFLLLFWIILFLTVAGRFASHFGADSLFLAPEYLGKINFVSMLLLGTSMSIFIMAWHISTFIIHSKRMPFIGATRHAFLNYCINNSIIPLVFFVFYSVLGIRFQRQQEEASWNAIILMQLGFYLGFLIMIIISFAYFFRVGRDLLKTVLATITNPAHLRNIIPYDGLDFEFDMIQADTFFNEKLVVEPIANLEQYHPRLLNTILRRHHRNAVAATIFAILFLLILGIFMDQPLLRIPAGAGFLILFAVLMGVVSAVKYFLKSWEIIGWGLLFLTLGGMVHYGVFDLRSIAYGLNYHTQKKLVPTYNYASLKSTFNQQNNAEDIANGIAHLEAWKNRQTEALPPLVVISVSGGGTRSAYWTFRSLQYADSLSGGSLFKRAIMLTGASGGMIGATNWRNLHQKVMEGKIQNPYLTKYQQNIGKDLLNAIIFSFAAVDLISPFNKINLAGYSYTKDRGYAMEQELLHNTDSLISGCIGDYAAAEKNASIPQLIFNSTIINDGRRLMISTQPLGFLTHPCYSKTNAISPVIDAVDFATFFKNQDPYNLQLTTALRMNATFPFVLPVVRLPSIPQINVMDAGLRDNFGTEVVSRWLYVFRDWINTNTREVIWLQIRDTRDFDVLPPTPEINLDQMLSDPLFVIQNKWEPFQSSAQSYVKEYMSEVFKQKIKFVSLQYFASNSAKTAKLNFHLTQQEKEDLYQAIYEPSNLSQMDTLVRALR